jgi:hypothetical protein
MFSKNGIEYYNTVSHIHKGHFDNPFPCPECTRQGADFVLMIQDLSHWKLYIWGVYNSSTTDELVGTSESDSSTTSGVDGRATVDFFFLDMFAQSWV